MGVFTHMSRSVLVICEFAFRIRHTWGISNMGRRLNAAVCSFRVMSHPSQIHGQRRAFENCLGVSDIWLRTGSAIGSSIGVQRVLVGKGRLGMAQWIV